MLNPKTIDDASIEQRVYQLNLGPQHPSTHGVMHLLVTLDGEVVIKLEPVIGYSHRGHEKMAENRTYEQFLPNPPRMDYLSGMIFNHGYCMAVEKLCGIEVPRRAEYIRVITAELNRIASHFIGAMDYAMGLGAITPFLWGWDDREHILDLLEGIAGSRLTYSYSRFGGVRNDITKAFYDGTRRFIDRLRGRFWDYENLINQNIIFIKRSQDVGVITREVALSYGVTGPTLRGSGVAYDVRKQEPYSVYPEFQFEIPTREAGDCLARYQVRMAELEQSLNIIEQAVEKLPAGDVRAALPKRIRPEASEVYARTETPKGELGYYIVSDGTQSPFRVKVKSPCFVNLSALPAISRGAMIADIVAILGSFDIVLGEVDR